MSFDCYWEVEGIKGESPEENHKDWIKCLSLNYGFMHPCEASGSSGSRVMGKSERTDITIMKEVDLSSCQLMTRAINGKPFGKMVFHIVRQSGDKANVLVITLENVVITSIQASAGGGGVPNESVSLDYNKININYTKLNDSTGMKEGEDAMGWDWQKNIPA